MINIVNQEAILEEIFLRPSNEVKADRFITEQDDAAACRGQCASGACRAVNLIAC